MLRGSIAAIAAAASVVFGTPASATTLNIQAAGTFDDQAAELFDLPWQLSITYSFNDADVLWDDTAHQSYVFAGSDFGRPTAVNLQANMNGALFSFASFANGSAVQSRSTLQQDAFGTGYAFVIGADFGDTVLDPDVTQPPAGDLCQVASCYLHAFSAVGFDGFITGITSYSITYDGGDPPDAPSPAPEPSAWALMLAGFGLAGAALRRRRAFA